jgi:site-specific DNA-methyltransferase (adenine-specific)
MRIHLQHQANVQVESYREYLLPNSQTGIVYLADALDLLRSLPAFCSDLIFLDPPFNLGKNYLSGDPSLDTRSKSEYQEWMEDILALAEGALKPGGSLYLYHLPEWAMRLGAFLDRHLQFRHWIAISMKNGFVRGDHLYPAHYGLLYFTKGNPNRFYRPKLEPERCRSCGKTIKDYGGYLSIIEERGINLSDFWDDLSPVRHSNRKLRDQNQLPLKMLDRIVDISGPPGGLYIDPFAGTGTGVVAAIHAQMSFIAGDIVQENCDIIDQRVTEHLEGGQS